MRVERFRSLETASFDRARRYDLVSLDLKHLQLGISSGRRDSFAFGATNLLLFVTIYGNLTQIFNRRIILHVGCHSLTVNDRVDAE